MKLLKRIGQALITFYACVVILLVFIVFILLTGLIIIKDYLSD